MTGPEPLRERRSDLVFIAFFLFNLVFITYMFDLEQIVIVDPRHFGYPVWPPGPVIDLVHWYGNRYDPLLMARPPFWRATIWIDVLFFGPFYAAAGYAFWRGRPWIRVPALVWSGTMLANVFILLTEEYEGQWASPHFPMVLGANLCWFLLPLATIWRMRRDRPFERRPRGVAVADKHTDKDTGKDTGGATGGATTGNSESTGERVEA